jgi:hypothetical protein
LIGLPLFDDDFVDFSVAVGVAVAIAAAVTMAFALTVLLLEANALINFFAMNGNVFWGLYPKAYLVPLYPEHRYIDIAADHDGLADTSCQNEHEIQPPLSVIFISFSNADILEALKIRLILHLPGDAFSPGAARSRRPRPHAVKYLGRINELLRFLSLLLYSSSS